MRKVTRILNPYWSDSENPRVCGKDAKGVLYIMSPKPSKSFFGEKGTKDLPKQFFAITDTMEYVSKDKDGNPIAGKPVVKREEVIAAFLTKEEAYEAFNDDRLLEAECEAHYQAAVATLKVDTTKVPTSEELNASA